MPDPPAKGDGSLIRATITRYESRWRVQPPTQVTSQSPKREPKRDGRAKAEKLGFQSHSADRDGSTHRSLWRTAKSSRESATLLNVQ